jgi:pantetheine-phosphate adenylyltransferase
MACEKKQIIYAGTFDPITNGHLNIIERGLKIFDEVVIAVALSTEKKPMFDIDERVQMIRNATANLKNITVEPFDNLLVEFAQQKGIKNILRGLRTNTDFEYELQLGYANNSLYSELETVYLTPNINKSFISSSIVRSILKYNGSIKHLVPKEVLDFIENKNNK